MIRSARCLALAVVIITPAIGAQSLDAALGPRSGPVALTLQHVRPLLPASDGHTDAAVSNKSAGTAVFLSFLVPGAGSFYAGESGHGWRHLIVHLVGYGMVVGGTTSCVTAGGEDCSEISGVATAGTVAVLGNWVWGMVTANRDAKVFNARITP